MRGILATMADMQPTLETADSVHNCEGLFSLHSATTGRKSFTEFCLSVVRHVVSWPSERLFEEILELCFHLRQIVV